MFLDRKSLNRLLSMHDVWPLCSQQPSHVLKTRIPWFCQAAFCAPAPGFPVQVTSPVAHLSRTRPLISMVITGHLN